MYRRILVAVLMVTALSQVSCSMIARLAQAFPPPKQKVAAEFTRLAGRKTLVHVWVDPGALIDYPWARYELADNVAAEIEAHVPDADIVDPARVEDRFESSYQNSFDPVAMGKSFNAEMVVYLEVHQLSLRDPATPQLLRGRIQSSVVVYDLTADGQESQRFELTPVDVQVPKERSLGVYQANPIQVRLETYDEYAATVAQRFYDHELEI